ncbi:thymidylate kinase [Purpureocillium lavendulum]|uniref:Thymidylate kinase n=1 Tax=Purpureocillium lavendulum TaxID=1247861 RepID=A0AB34FMJ0_9HYPO|nr:thymidylate kinase [Purpureocillium lavendulum]
MTPLPTLSLTYSGSLVVACVDAFLAANWHARMASINDLATAAIASSSASPPPPQQQTSSTTATASTPRGAFIVLEGLDRSGKTTQVKLLEQRFVEAGRPVKVMRFPDRSTPIGQMIDSYLKSDVAMEDHVIHLLFSANRWEAAAHISALLAAGTTLVCDRFHLSGIAYSAAKRNPALPLPWAAGPERGLPRPDLVLFLDLDERAARARGGWGDERYEREAMQARVRAIFRDMAGADAAAAAATASTTAAATAAAPTTTAASTSAPASASTSDSTPTAGASASAPAGGHGPAAALRSEEIAVVDAGASVEDVAEEIWRRVEAKVRQVDAGELGAAVSVVE